MFMGGGMTGGATESTAGCPWKGEPAGGENNAILLHRPASTYTWCVTMATMWMQSFVVESI